MPMRSSHESHGTNEGNTPSQIDSCILAFVLQYCACHEFPCERPSNNSTATIHCFAVAAPCHGDFIRTVGRAYRMSADASASTGILSTLRTSAGVIRPQGFLRCCIRTQNTALPRCQVLRGGLKNRSKDTGPRGNTVRGSSLNEQS